uniref:glutathione transferase n=1 Tax=Globodera pallida TaxID=36090 RepID=A0A183BI77_GLOPA
MVQYKLYYFDVRGIGEPIRLLLHYVGQQFEDVRFGKEEWPTKYKSKFFYGKAPVLEVDGKQLGQSTTILRFLAEKFALAGKDEWEKAKADEIINFQKDANTELAPYLYVKIGLREGDLDKLRVEVLEPGVKRIFPLFEALLKESGSDYMLPSGLSMVDFQVGNFLYTFTKLEPDTIKAYPELIKYVERVHALPQLQKYLKLRPQDR